jgi:hypothetical protein
MRYRITGWMWWVPVIKVIGRLVLWALLLTAMGLVGALLLVALFTKMGY